MSATRSVGSGAGSAARRACVTVTRRRRAIYDPDDVVRSFRRLVFAMVGAPWSLSLERREVKDEARPAGLVEIGQTRASSARSAIPQGPVVYAAPVTVTLYPSLASPREAGRTARILAHGLHQLIAVGADGPVFEDGRPAAGPERVPLYDFSPVPLTGSAEQREGPEFPHDVLWVEDYGARALQDPMDPQRWSVVLDARVSWEAPGRVSSADDPITTAMPLTYELTLTVPEDSADGGVVLLEDGDTMTTEVGNVLVED